MNLKAFIDYRKKCPLCDNTLKLSFHSKRKQSSRYEDNRMLFLFTLLNGKQKSSGQQKYSAGYSFGLEDDSIYIEFYEESGVRFDNEVPEFLRTRFKSLNENLGKYRFYKYCNGCCCYNYSSNFFTIQYNKTYIEDVNIYTEYIGMAEEVKDGYKIYKLLNNYIENQSILLFGKNKLDYLISSDYGMVNFNHSNIELDMIKTSLIKFSSKTETMERLQKLLIFS